MFDTIDHRKLPHGLDVSFGIQDNALDWFSFYLKDKHICQIGDDIYEDKPLKFRVPQGSVLGPILFTIYTTPLVWLIQNNSLGYHLYADDAQLCLTF